MSCVAPGADSLHCALCVPSIAMSEFAAEVEQLRPLLLRFALGQLRNPAWAEDAVSDTVLAALEKRQAFAGHSQLKTWLIGILKHKLIDQLRRHAREATLLSDDDVADVDAQLFDQRGGWLIAPKAWGEGPDDQLSQREFFVVLEACVEHLPPSQARVFMMREWLELDATEVCKTLAITSTNLWVLLHRARLRLRECLQTSWFDARPQDAV